jgi:hypothetical protein
LSHPQEAILPIVAAIHDRHCLLAVSCDYAAIARNTEDYPQPFGPLKRILVAIVSLCLLVIFAALAWQRGIFFALEGMLFNLKINILSIQAIPSG